LQQGRNEVEDGKEKERVKMRGCVRASIMHINTRSGLFETVTVTARFRGKKQYHSGLTQTINQTPLGENN